MNVDGKSERLMHYASSQEFRAIKPVTERYLALLAFLHSEQPREFERSVLSISKLARVYFATTREVISESGRSTQPQAIGNTGLWALTNMSAENKRHMIADVAAILGYPPEVVTAASDALR